MTKHCLAITHHFFKKKPSLFVTSYMNKPEGYRFHTSCHNAVIMEVRKVIVEVKLSCLASSYLSPLSSCHASSVFLSHSLSYHHYSTYSRWSLITTISSSSSSQAPSSSSSSSPCPHPSHFRFFPLFLFLSIVAAAICPHFSLFFSLRILPLPGFCSGADCFLVLPVDADRLTDQLTDRVTSDDGQTERRGVGEKKDDKCGNKEEKVNSA